MHAATVWPSMSSPPLPVLPCRQSCARLLVQWRVGALDARPGAIRHKPVLADAIETGEHIMTQSRGSFRARGAPALAITLAPAAAVSLAACSSPAPVEFSLTGADSPSL